MAELEVRHHDQADEVRPFVANGHVDIVKLAGGVIGRGTFEPGWRWSEHVKPIAGTDSCQAPHMGYCVAGRMVVRMDDGTEKEIGARATCSSSRPATTPGWWATSPASRSTSPAWSTTRRRADRGRSPERRRADPRHRRPRTGLRPRRRRDDRTLSAVGRRGRRSGLDRDADPGPCVVAVGRPTVSEAWSPWRARSRQCPAVDRLVLPGTAPGTSRSARCRRSCSCGARAGTSRATPPQVMVGVAGDRSTSSNERQYWTMTAAGPAVPPKSQKPPSRRWPRASTSILRHPRARAAPSARSGLPNPAPMRTRTGAARRAPPSIGPRLIAAPSATPSFPQGTRRYPRGRRPVSTGSRAGRRAGRTARNERGSRFGDLLPN